MKKMKKQCLAFVSLGILMSLITGCAVDTLGTSCPHFGESCTKTPINSWDHDRWEKAQ